MYSQCSKPNSLGGLEEPIKTDNIITKNKVTSEQSNKNLFPYNFHLCLRNSTNIGCVKHRSLLYRSIECKILRGFLLSVTNNSRCCSFTLSNISIILFISFIFLRSTVRLLQKIENHSPPNNHCALIEMMMWLNNDLKLLWQDLASFQQETPLGKNAWGILT